MTVLQNKAASMFQNECHKGGKDVSKSPWVTDAKNYHKRRGGDKNRRREAKDKWKKQKESRRLSCGAYVQFPNEFASIFILYKNEWE